MQIEHSDGAPARRAKIFLSPSSEVSASHAGKQYAVLFPAKKGGREGKAISYESGKGVPIDVQGESDRLVDAAARRIAVEVEVVEKQKRRKWKKSKHAGWKLRAITIPAPDKKQ